MGLRLPVKSGSMSESRILTGLTKHVMMDAETMGNRAGCAMVSLGAVEFDESGYFGRTFYRVIDLQSCLDQGLFVEGSTVNWWLKQGDEARQSILANPDGTKPESLNKVLLDFSDWLPRGARLWAHGATFDPPIIEAAYKAAGLFLPWKFRDVRDTRTIYELAGVKIDRDPNTYHHALDDAKAQASGVQASWIKLKPKTPAETQAVLNDLRYFVNNPSAWDGGFCQNVSDAIERVVKAAP